MGMNNSVKKLLEQSKQNEKRLEEIKKELEAQQAEAGKTLREEQKNFYVNNQREWKFSDYVYGANSDFQTSATWSLDNLNAIIQQITSAVVGILGPVGKLPEGVETSPDVESINKEGGITDDMRLLVASNCLNLLTGIVNSFGKSSKVQVSTATNSIPIGQGLRIFASVSCNVTQERGFFNNQVMSSYRYGYVVSYSLDEFLQQAEQTLVAQYEMTLNALNIAAKDNYNSFAKKEIDLRQYKETADFIEEMTIEIIEKIKVLNQRERALDRTERVYEDQIKFLKHCLIEYGFDTEVSTHITAQIKKLSHLSAA